MRVWGKVLRFGANNDEVLNRLAWMRDELAPAVKRQSHNTASWNSSH
ncbi:DUF1116 domain-containing protein [Escherichia coli]|nr:DUF1116 domain-containing protein [Escherichia coli]